MIGSTPEASASTIFELYPYDGSHIGQQLSSLISDGTLPTETWFKLAALGHNETDPESGVRLSWAIVTDIITNSSRPELLNKSSKRLLESPMPDAIIDWHRPGHNALAYASFDTMYYQLNDLATVIHENERNHEDKSFKRRMAQVASKGIWRVLVNRNHPEWLCDPELYYAPRISFDTVRDVNKHTMRRRIIARAVLSDTLLFDTYTEADTVGVRGIGPKGKDSLRLLLSEEHPELL